MTFHLANGVGIGKGCEGGRIRGKRGAEGCLAEGKELVGESARLINRQGVTQRGPLGGFLAAKFESEFLPLSSLLW